MALHRCHQQHGIGAYAMLTRQAMYAELSDSGSTYELTSTTSCGPSSASDFRSALTYQTNTAESLGAQTTETSHSVKDSSPGGGEEKLAIGFRAGFGCSSSWCRRRRLSSASEMIMVPATYQNMLDKMMQTTKMLLSSVSCVL